MFTNRFSKLSITAVVIAFALLTVSFATLKVPFSSTYLTNRSDDKVERVRIERQVGNLLADRTYDLIEDMRSSQLAMHPRYNQAEQLRIFHLLNVMPDQSYNQVEALRIQRSGR